MIATVFERAASLSAPIVLVLLIVAVVLLVFRASCGALDIVLKQRVLRRVDVSIALALLLFAVTVIWRFKVIG
jgi:hypothetical protein